MTDDEIVEIAKQSQTAESGTNGYILPIAFARLIQARVREECASTRLCRLFGWLAKGLRND